MHHSDAITADDLDRLLAEKAGPCVSIFLPTTPVTQDTDRDRIELRNLRSAAFEQLMADGLRRPDAEALLAPVDELMDDDGFWPYLSDGLAVFASPAMHAVYRIPLSPAPGLDVGPRFSLKPLIPLLNDDGVFHILALSQDEVRLFEGTRHHVAPLKLDHLPANMTRALAMRGRGGRAPNRLWQGDEGQKNLYRKYFRQIDRALKPYYGSGRGPLVLAGVDYLMPIYREANSYRFLVDEGIAGNPEQLSAAELHERVWPIVAPVFAAPRQQALAAYARLTGTGRTSAEPEEILNAALDGRIETLFVSLGDTPWGSFDPDSRAFARHDAPQPGDADLAAQAARWAYRTGAAIFAGAPPEIPADGPLSAVLRYA